MVLLRYFSLPEMRDIGKVIVVTRSWVFHSLLLNSSSDPEISTFMPFELVGTQNRNNCKVVRTLPSSLLLNFIASPPGGSRCIGAGLG